LGVLVLGLGEVYREVDHAEVGVAEAGIWRSGLARARWGISKTPNKLKTRNLTPRMMTSDCNSKGIHNVTEALLSTGFDWVQEKCC
jgi:hypothetical protein